jgi:hypothetical protein
VLDAAARDGLRRELVAWLRCLRGVDTLTALGLVAEIGTDWSPDRGAVHELRRAGAVGALLRPAALPGIDRAAGGHVRRLLVEARGISANARETASNANPCGPIAAPCRGTRS